METKAEGTQGDRVQDVLRENDLLCSRLGVMVNSTCSVPVAYNNTFVIIKVIVTLHVTAFSLSVGQIKLPRSAESPEINLCSGSALQHPVTEETT